MRIQIFCPSPPSMFMVVDELKPPIYYIIYSDKRYIFYISLITVVIKIFLKIYFL